MKLDRFVIHLLLFALISSCSGTAPVDSVPEKLPEKVAEEAPGEAPILDDGWPKDVVAGETTFVVYQPQLDSWDGYVFEAHSAVAVEEKDAESTLYGVVSLRARTQVDKTERLVTFDRLEITEARFPSAEDRQESLAQALEASVADAVRVIGLDRLEAGMAVLEAQRQGEEVPVLSQPPVIVFSDGPAILIYIDGEPVYRQVEGTEFQRILNTRSLVLMDSRLLFGWA